MVDLIQQYDFFAKRGDSPTFKFKLRDNELNGESVSSFTLKFSVRDEYEKLDGIIQKYWNSIADKDGIITFADAEAPTYNLVDDSEIAIVLETDDTKNLRVDVYPFDIEFKKNVLGVDKYFTPIKGNLIIEPDITRNV